MASRHLPPQLPQIPSVVYQTSRDTSYSDQKWTRTCQRSVNTGWGCSHPHAHTVPLPCLGATGACRHESTEAQGVESKSHACFASLHRAYKMYTWTFSRFAIQYEQLCFNALRSVQSIRWVYTVLYTPMHQELFEIQTSGVSAFQGQVCIIRVGPIVGTCKVSAFQGRSGIPLWVSMYCTLPTINVPPVNFSTVSAVIVQWTVSISLEGAGIR